MTIKANIEGGGTLEFPDDTPYDVIQNKVKEYTTPDALDIGTGLMRQAARGVPVISPLVAKAQAAGEASLHLLRPGPGISHATGSGSMMNDWLQRYSEDLEREHAKEEAFQSQYPKSSAAAQIAGGTAALAPLGATRVGAAALGLGGRTLVGQVGRSAASGGAISGLDEALRGGSLEDVEKAAGLGAGIGAAIPPVARATSTVAAPVARAVQGMFSPQQAAQEAVASAEQQARQAGGTTTPGGIQAAQRLGYPMANIDIGANAAGVNTTNPVASVARAAANLDPEARQQLNDFLQQRFQGQGQRTADFLNGQMNYPNEPARNQAIQWVRENVYQPRYTQAYRDSAATPLWPDRDLISAQRALGQPFSRDQLNALEGLRHLTEAPQVQDAIRYAQPMLRNWAVRDGVRAPAPAFAFDNSGNVPRVVLTGTGGGNTNLPSLHLWDYIKRALDSMDTQPASQLSRALRDNLDTLVPSYRNARAAAEPVKFFDGANNAYEAGQNFVNNGSRYGNDATQRLARMTPQERALFQDGYTQALVERINKRPDRLTVLNQINQSPAARQEVETALGPQRFQAIEAHLRIEEMMDVARRVVQGNSTTAQQLAGMRNLAPALPGAATAIAVGMLHPMALVTAALTWGARRAGVALDQRVAQQVAQLLVSNNPGQLRLANAVLTRRPELMNALRLGSTLVADEAQQLQRNQRQ